MRNIKKNIDVLSRIDKESNQDSNDGDGAVIDGKSELRKLARYEKWILYLLILLPIVQLISIVTVSTVAAVVINIVCLVLIFILSRACKQYAMLFVSLMLIMISSFIVLSGFKHGMIKDDLSDKSILNINYLNNKTPLKTDDLDFTKEEIISNFSGKFVYYYKYRCKDCIAIDSSLKSLIQSKGYDMIPIEVRSDLGKQMLEMFPVGEVPAGLVLSEDGSCTIRILYVIENGEAVFDANALMTLFDEIDKTSGANYE